MCFPNCAFDGCPPGLSPDEIYECTKILNNLQQMPTLFQQGEECSTFDQAIPDLPFNAVDVPITPWFQEPNINTQHTANTFSDTDHETSMHTAQPTGHQEGYCQANSLDTESTREQNLQDRHGLSMEAAMRHPQGTAGPRPKIIKCCWIGCQYTGTFGRKTDLMRHLETKHVSPKKYKCSFPGCVGVFNRTDNLQGHLRRVHAFYGPYR